MAISTRINRFGFSNRPGLKAFWHRKICKRKVSKQNWKKNWTNFKIPLKLECRHVVEIFVSVTMTISVAASDENFINITTLRHYRLFCVTQGQFWVTKTNSAPNETFAMYLKEALTCHVSAKWRAGIYVTSWNTYSVFLILNTLPRALLLENTKAMLRQRQELRKVCLHNLVYIWYNETFNLSEIVLARTILGKFIDVLFRFVFLDSAI